MSEKPNKVTELVASLQTLSNRVFRPFYEMGKQYQGNRDIYQALGYEKDLEYEDYWLKYKRQDIARAAIHRLATHVWRGGFKLKLGDEHDDDPIEKAYDELSRTLNLPGVYMRADILTMLGRYGGILIGFGDANNKEQLMEPPSGKQELRYLRPLGEDSMRISKVEPDPSNPRYTKPLLYEVTIARPTDNISRNPVRLSTDTLTVHHERIIHITYDALEDHTYGTPFLEAVYNRLEDLEKLAGGSAEMFWRGARPGYQGVVDPEHDLDADTDEEMKKALQEFEHNLRRVIMFEGVEFKPLAMQVADPMGHFDVQIQLISAALGIPKRILTGSERGELASLEDRQNWFEIVTGRREYYAEAHIIRPFIDRMIKYGVIPPPGEQVIKIKWQDLDATSERSRMEVNRIKSEILLNYTQNPAAVDIMPPELFAEMFLNLPESDVQKIVEAYNAMVEKEEKEMEEAREFQEKQLQQRNTGGPTP